MITTTNVIHICGACRRAKATHFHEDECTGLTRHRCDTCHEYDQKFWEAWLDAYGEAIFDHASD